MRFAFAVVSLSASLASLAMSQERLHTFPADMRCRLLKTECARPEGGIVRSLRKTSQASQTASYKVLNFTKAEDWSSPFYPQGILDAVTSFQVAGDSILVTGKIGSRADSARMWGVSLWDGKKWTSVVSRPGLCGLFWGFLQESGGKIFFGPYSLNPQNAGAPETQPLATWDGMSWKTREVPVNQANNQLLAFASALTRWNGDLMYASWLDGIWKLGDTAITPFLLPDKGVGGPEGKKDVIVVGMTVHAGNLWAMGGILENAFAFHDGQKWNYPGIPTMGGISWAFMGKGGFFLDGGTSTSAGVSVDEKVGVIRWDGTDWQRIPLDSAMRYPRHLATDGQDMFLIGYDRYLAVNPGLSLTGKGLWIAKWNGESFQIVDRRDFTGLIMQAAYDHGRLFLGGGFNYVGDLRADNLAMWDGSRWHSFTQGFRPGLAGNASVALSWNGKLVFGGRGIMAAGSKRASGIAAWDGTEFEIFGNGIPAKVSSGTSDPEIISDVNCLTAAGGTLYAGGKFDSAGTGAARNIARWDGHDWSPLGEGLPGQVTRVFLAESTLYALSLDSAAGLAGGPPARKPFQWTGGHWDAMGKSPAAGFGSALTRFGGSVWACSGAEILKWDGKEWDTVRVGNHGRIFDLVPYRNDLLVSADKGLFRFDGLALDTIPEVGFADFLVSEGENLYVYGSFKIPGYPDMSLARWDGKQWHLMGDFVYSLKGMTIHGDYLYVYLDEQPDSWDVQNYDLYFRWNSKTGTWSRPVTRKGGAGGFAWEALPCAHDCFLSQGAAGAEAYDFQGRKVSLGSRGNRGAAGVKALKAKR